MPGSVAWETIENAIQAWIVGATGLAGDHVIWQDQNKGRPTPPFVTMTGGDRPLGFDRVTTIDVALVATVAPTVVTPATDTFTAAAHGRSTGDGPFQAFTTGSLPGGVSPATNYWLVVVDANTLKLSASFLGSIASSPTVVDVTSAGSGTLTFESTPDTVSHGKEIQQTARGDRAFTVSIQAYVGDGQSIGQPSARAIVSDIIAAAYLPSVRQALNDAGVGVGGFGIVRQIPQIIDTVVYEPRAQVDADLFITSELSELDTYIASADVTPTYDGAQGAAFHVPDDTAT